MNDGELPYGPVYIQDGYTVDAYLKGVRGMYGPVRFKHRFLMFLEHSRITEAMNNAADAESRSRVILALMARQVISWDVKTPRGEAADPTNVKDWEHMHPTAITRMWLMVTCEIPPDPDPQKFGPSEAESILEAIEQPDVGKRVEAQQKN